ncbi:hypothetical protein R5M92_03540 [Halomonas sp. Bachu 37]|uniref:hypothetical protein n=1 Tax=Halomonas kashgarensis TaxID=3084920 RepID=UPI003216791A
MKSLRSSSRITERLIALFVVALLLFCPPLLLVVNRYSLVDSLPWLPLYLFLAWGLVIALAAWLMESG